jgi:hypothetical protein
MLLGDDVIHLEGQGVVRSRQMAVLAPILRDLPKLMQYPTLHQLMRLRLTGCC